MNDEADNDDGGADDDDAIRSNILSRDDVCHHIILADDTPEHIVSHVLVVSHH